MGETIELTRDAGAEVVAKPAGKPIIFSAPMVQALLAGRKTQTRRTFSHKWPVLGAKWGKKAPWAGLDFDKAEARSASIWSNGDPHLRVPFVHPEDAARGVTHDEDGCWYRVRPPYGAGDRLWVREAVGRRPASFLGIEATNGVESAFYIADEDDVLNEHEFNLCPWWRGKTCSPIHMPRWASRLTLDVTDVRVQRLQDISEEDAVAEGLWYCEEGDAAGFWFDGPEMKNAYGDGSIACYADLWDSINGDGAWATNPWVVALTFDVHRANIDALTRTLGGAPRLSDAT